MLSAFQAYPYPQDGSPEGIVYVRLDKITSVVTGTGPRAGTAQRKAGYMEIGVDGRWFKIGYPSYPEAKQAAATLIKLTQRRP